MLLKSYHLHEMKGIESKKTRGHKSRVHKYLIEQHSPHDVT